MRIDEQKTIALLLAGVLVASAHSVHAQDSNSPLMVGLEQPFAQPVFYALSDDAFTSSTMPSGSSGYILQQSHEVYSDFPANLTQTCENCGQYGCTDSHVCAESCVEEEPWWKRKAHKLNRKCYFNYHSYHPKALHPIVHPACQPGYGYYETCWRRISPNPCFCRPEHVPAYTGDQGPPDGLTYPQTPEGEPLPPAPAYDQ